MAATAAPDAREPQSPGPGAGLLHRVPALDGLRAVAVALVFGTHFTAAVGGRFATVLGTWWRQGHLGVDCFFVLSGYLITTILLRERGDPRGLTRFWKRRALRILPAYFLYLVALMLLARFTRVLADPHDYAMGADAPLFFSFLGNVPNASGRDPGHVLTPLWSLAIEEQFYLLWPFAVRALRPRAAVYLAGALVLTGAALRAILWDSVGAERLYYMTPTRLDGLLVGALLAYALADPRWRARVLRASVPSFAPACAVLALALATRGGVYGTEHRELACVGPTLVALAFAAVLVHLLEGRGLLTRVLSSRPFVAVGRVSYGMYLVHMLVGVGAARWLPNAPGELRMASWIGASWAVAWALYEGVEKRFTALGGRASDPAGAPRETA